MRTIRPPIYGGDEGSELPRRISILEDILEFVASHDHVWKATGQEIIRIAMEPVAGGGLGAAVAGSTSCSSAMLILLAQIAAFPVVAFGAGVQRYFADTFPHRARIVVVRSVEVLELTAAFVEGLRDNVSELVG